MKAYRLSIPTDIYFGRNILKDVISKQQNLIKGKVFIVTTGRSLIRLGHLEILEELLQELPYVEHVIVFDEISANPRLAEVKAGILFGKQEKVNIVVGFGGGSALDAAKAISVGIGHDDSIEDFFYNRKEPTNKTLPVVAIPTTAGTGSELSKAAILTDEERKVKGGIRGAALYPKLAIVDSQLTETVPIRITMETGFDVLAHAIESYISKAATPYTEMQSEHAIRIVGQYLPRLMIDLQDVKAREKMSFASMIMGINLGNASTCLPHRLQYPIGAHTDTSHGRGLAALYPTWMGYEYQYSDSKVKKVMELLTGMECKNSEDVVRSMSKFIANLGLNVSLREIGITDSMITRITKEVTGNLQNDPVSQDKNIIEKIYHTAL
ncbi:MAG: iron-containing alcohol dehydrogenase [Ruminococcus flavefaciens]|nr:iron-containing alcohol dehydrogenase [Ruminococcus flavefaciens]